MMRRIAVLLCLLFGLAACQIESDGPLFDASEGLRVFGASSTLLAVEKDGAISIDKEGVAGVITMRFNRGVYRLESDAGEVFLTASFHPIPGLTDIYAAQVIMTETPDTAIYIAVRENADGLGIDTISMTDTLRTVLEQNGITSEKSGTGFKVENRADLDELLRLWAQINLRKLTSPEGIQTAFLIERGAGAGLRARAAEASCLALAGHPLDPAVKALPKKWRDGQGLDAIDTERALAVCAQAATRASPPSVRYSLARVYEAMADYNKSDALLDPLIAENFALGFVMRAEHLVYGHGVKKDLDAARAILLGPASKGMIVPAYLLGFYEVNGTLGAVNTKSAKRWLRVAADGGIADAQYRLGMILREQDSTVKEAYGWFRKAAEQDNIYGSYEAGRALYFGRGVDQDRSAAYRDFLKAAQGDIPWAQYYLGFMAARAQGTTKNEKSAVEWLEKAHAGGVLPATGELGRMIYHGLGTKADTTKGLRLLKEAADKGDKNAKDYLAALKPAAPPPPKTTNVPDAFKRDVDKLVNGRPFELTETNLPFMTGLASDLLDRCGAPRNDFAARAQLATFVASSTFGSIMGFDYSNPNLAESLGSMGRSQAALIAGGLFGKTVPCGAVADRYASAIADALKSNSRGKDGGASVFVKSCTPHFDARRCACLANAGRQAIPNLHRQVYDRWLIKQIIERNPFVGLQIAMACQIGNY